MHSQPDGIQPTLTPCLASSMSSAHRASSVMSPSWWRMLSSGPTRTSWQPAVATSGTPWQLRKHGAPDKCWSWWTWSQRCSLVSSTSSTAQRWPHPACRGHRWTGGSWKKTRNSFFRKAGRTKATGRVQHSIRIYKNKEGGSQARGE